MRLRSFHGPTLADAMRQARETLGDHAIIVSTRDDDVGGVRVTAALDDVPVREISKKIVVHENDAIEDLSNHLYRHGFSAALTEKLLATAMASGAHDAMLALAAGFEAHIGFKDVLTPPQAKPIVLVGQPGAGKTVTTAKLATQARLKQKPVCVITTDLTRAGGIDQLAAFTKILKLKLLEIEDPAALRDTLALHGGNTVTLVDTAGQNPLVHSGRNELRALLGSLDADIVFVLPAGLEMIEGTELAVAYKDVGAKSVIVTRGDLVRRLGGALSIAHGAGLPIAGFVNSGNVADPVIPMNAISLTKLILPAALTAKEPSTGTHA